MNKSLSVLVVSVLLAFNGSATIRWEDAWRIAEKKGCDTLILVDGRQIVAEIERVTRDEIIYSPCNDPLGRSYVLSRKKVKAVHAFREPVQPIEKPPINQELMLPSHQKAQKKLPGDPAEQYANRAFIWGLISMLFLPTLIGAPISLILGIMALGAAGKALKLTRNHPRKRRLRTLIWIGMICGILAVVGSIVLLIAALTLRLPDLSGLQHLDLSGWHW